MTAPLAELACAKINLTLRVRGRRPDGYHELESLVAFADAAACDRLTFSPGGSFRLQVTGAGAGALAEDDPGSNLVARAMIAAARAEPRLIGGAFHLDKGLPVAAGIGGGSADAAAALRLLRRANPDLAGGVDWMAVAATIGADVPVCLVNCAALMGGIGERVTPLAALPPVWAVLANPRLPLSTAGVFKALDAPLLAPAADGEAVPLESRVFTRAGELLAHVAALGNDLEAPAMRLCPAVGEVLGALAALDGARLARMSGSGPTCFALFHDERAAAGGARGLAARQPGWWVRATRLR